MIDYGADGFFWGIPDHEITIPGFTVKMGKHDWGMATDPEGREYFIQEHRDHYILLPNLLGIADIRGSIRVEKPCI